MKSDAITVEVRLSAKLESKVKGYGDATIPLGDDGTITILGFSVLDGDGRPPRVMTPARKGKQAWFEIVQLSGKIHTLVEAAILGEYERQKNGSK